MALTVIADITIQEAKVDFVKSQITKLALTSREEKGCIEYKIHQDNDKPNHFMIYENWESKEDLEAHSNSSHMKKYAIAAKGFVIDSAIYKLTKLI